MPQLLLHLSLNLNLNLVRQRLRFRQRLWIELQLQRRNKVFQHLQNKRTKLFGLLPFQESISFIQKHEIVDTHSKNGEKFRQINYLVFSNFFSKTVTFTKLLPKKCESMYDELVLYGNRKMFSRNFRSKAHFSNLLYLIHLMKRDYDFLKLTKKIQYYFHHLIFFVMLKAMRSFL